MPVSLTESARALDKPLVVIAMGDPAGVGPEVILRALKNPRVYGACYPLVYGDAAVLDYTAARVGIDMRFERVDGPEDVTGQSPGPFLRSMSEIDTAEFRFGREDPAHAMLASLHLMEALEAAKAGRVDALVTAPIHKGSVHVTGRSHAHHNEMIAESVGEEGVSLLLGDVLKVSLCTGHCPLRDVAERLTPERVQRTILLMHDALTRYFELPAPRIGVAGLNPHAAEGDDPRSEEREVIAPAVRAARNAGAKVEGPFAADSLFVEAVRGKFHGVVAMYHDQGTVPFKQLHFDAGLTVTLGLPIIRTGAAHGVAYNIAGRGTASERSMLGAILTAAKIAAVERPGR